MSTKIQKKPIWMYIIDNDGLANSDKRFPTKLRNNRNGWMHDEISGWVSTDGEEMVGLLEERWMNFDDSKTKGTEWIDDKGETVRLRKGEFVEISEVLIPKAYHCLLPEFYLRQRKSHFITQDDLTLQISQIKKEIQSLNDLT
ncbi:MAG: hypothetical protein ACYC6W_09635 [Nitrosotalea sp.]